jgi:hypothetical protein
VPAQHPLRVGARPLRPLRPDTRRLRQPRPGVARHRGRPHGAVHRRPRHRGVLGHHLEARAGPDLRQLALLGAVVGRPRRAARPHQGRRVARRQLVRQHALRRHRARSLRGHRSDVVLRAAVPELGQAG